MYAISQNLIQVGVSESQVTNYCINVPSVELPEGHILLTKYGTAPLKNIIVFDAWWRILRNCGIRSLQDLTQFGDQYWPTCIQQMVLLQSKFSSHFLYEQYLERFEQKTQSNRHGCTIRRRHAPERPYGKAGITMTRHCQ